MRGAATTFQCGAFVGPRNVVIGMDGMTLSRVLVHLGVTIIVVAVHDFQEERRTQLSSRRVCGRDAISVASEIGKRSL